MSPARATWTGYGLAIVSSVVALLADAALNGRFNTPMTPFLPGFAAVIASAAWGGFGPGICATVLVDLWSAALLHSEHRHSVAGEVFRCALFAFEGVLLSIGSGRLRKALAQVADSDHWHRQLMQTASEGILVTDSAGNVTYANPRLSEILNAGNKTLVGRNVEEFYFPADLSMENIRLQNRRAGTREQFDGRLRRHDGSEAWMLTCASPLQNADGEFCGVLSMMTDITERKNAENALRQSENRFRGLFENVLEGVYQSTPDGRILAANPMLLRMLGVTHESDLNQVHIAKDLYTDPSIRARLLDRLEQDGSFQDVEYMLRRRDGQTITVQENARVVRDERGAVLYYEGTLTDVSEKKRMEQQLRQAQKMEALGRLAGGIAHDFSNVLTVVSGYAQLVLGELPAGHPARSNAELLTTAAESAAGLTQQLLSFSRRQPDAGTSVELNAVLADSRSEILEFLNDRTLGHPVELILQFSATLLPIDADAGHIRQTLMSLTANIRDNVPESRQISVVTESLRLHSSLLRRYAAAHTGPYAAVSVFSGTRRPMVSDAGGAEAADGFGLATADAIVSQYGGFMVMDRSASGQALFTVYLPLADETSERPLAPRAPSANGDTPQETILLVDDEPLVREISREMLERHGYRVLLAPGPNEAERICQQGNAFDLLITDVMMPQITGPELAKRLRAAKPDLRVLFISGYTDEHIANTGVSSADAFLQKPYSADSLERKIRQLLDRP